jgi:hypothetical protein
MGKGDKVGSIAAEQHVSRYLTTALRKRSYHPTRPLDTLDTVRIKKQLKIMPLLEQLLELLLY